MLSFLLEKEMATHSSTLALKIPWMEEPGRLQSTGSQRVRHDWATSLHFSFLYSLTLTSIHDYRGFGVPQFFFIEYIHIAAAKSLQSCPPLCDPIDGSPPGSPVPGILQARTLEWVAISFSNAGKWKVKMKSLSRVRLLATPWTAAYQAPPSMEFSRQEYWSGVPLGHI